MSNIITISLNPAIDATYWVEELHVDNQNRSHRERYEAAGKAVNVSRVLSAFTIPNEAIIMAGEGNLKMFEHRLQEEGLSFQLIPVPGYTRENISIIDEKTKQVTRLLCQGFTIPFEAVEKLQSKLNEMVNQESIVVISGRLPLGISATVLGKICKTITDKGGKFALDCTGLTLLEMQMICPWIMKPNHEEFDELLGTHTESKEEIIKLCREKLNSKGIEHCLISFGEEGILYVSAEKAFMMEVPVVEPLSTVGAGDASLAGFVMSVAAGHSVEHCVKTAASFGTASCLTIGSLPPTTIAAANISARVHMIEY